MKKEAGLLKQGKSVITRVRTHDLSPLIAPGTLVKLVPLSATHAVRRGDVVLARVRGRLVLHKVTGARTRPTGVIYQISDHHGRITGWVPRKCLLGAVSVTGEQLLSEVL